jgi:hypothetical protein
VTSQPAFQSNTNATKKLSVDLDDLPVSTDIVLKPPTENGTVAIFADIEKRSAKNAVRAATTANGTLATAFANGQTIDGVTLATGDRILIKNQTTATENGIYTVNASGARATDFDSTADVANGAYLTVIAGTTLASTFWFLTNTSAITFGTTNVTFGQLTAGGGGGGSSYMTDIGNGAATAFTVTHNLGTRDVLVQLCRNADNFLVTTHVDFPTVNTLNVEFSYAPSASEFRVIVYKI